MIWVCRILQPANAAKCVSLNTIFCNTVGGSSRAKELHKAGVGRSSFKIGPPTDSKDHTVPRPILKFECPTPKQHPHGRGKYVFLIQPRLWVSGGEGFGGVAQLEAV